VARRERPGFTLVEVLVGITIGLLLLAAFLATLDRCRAGFAANASIASLHDASRHALSVLVPDLEHAGFLGFASSAPVRVIRGGSTLADGAALRQSGATHVAVPVPGLPPGVHDCGDNFAVDVSLPVQMTNNLYFASGKCAPTGAAGGARAGTDTLTLRRASLETAAPGAGRIQLYTRRLESAAVATLFADGAAPGPVDENAEVRDLEVHTYYIANNSVGRPGWPALRVKALTESGGAAQFRDEEVLPGVEDLQVEIAVMNPQAHATTRYLAPTTDQLREATVVAVRVWLRIRADHTESDFSDARPMHYADVSFFPTGSEARIRRGLVERTVALRNLRLP
jgi:prepilin-type N-terminal cleavage/methylation domain-containing protein